MTNKTPNVTSAPGRSAGPHPDRQYIAGCGCASCELLRRQERARYAARRRGEPAGLVDVGPARRHIDYLQRCGMSIDEIADAAGLARSNTNAIAPPRRSTRRRVWSRIRLSTEQAILAVPLPVPAAVLEREAEPAEHLRIALADGLTAVEAAQTQGMSWSYVLKEPGCRRIVLAIATAEGVSAERAALQLGVSERTVVRLRSAAA